MNHMFSMGLNIRLYGESLKSLHVNRCIYTLYYM